MKLSDFLSIASTNLLTFADISILSLFKSTSIFSIETVLNTDALSVKSSISTSCSKGISSLILYTNLNPSTGTYSTSTFIIPWTILLPSSTYAFSTDIEGQTLTISFICMSSLSLLILSLTTKLSESLYRILFNSISLWSNLIIFCGE